MKDNNLCFFFIKDNYFSLVNSKNYIFKRINNSSKSIS